MSEKLEIWKDIPGYEGYYQASTHGRIRSLDRWVNDNGGQRLHKGKILKNRINNCGYFVTRFVIDNKVICHTTHKLIAMTFLTKSDPNLEIHHIDGDKLNNYINNLEYVTRGGHVKKTLKLKQYKPNIGEKHPKAKTTEEDVVNIRNRYKKGETIKELSKYYKVHKNTIFQIIRGINWSHIPGGIGSKAKRIPQDDKEKIKNLYSTGQYSYSKLMKQFKISKRSVARIIKNL
jgi:Mor family transcriptional regulator